MLKKTHLIAMAIAIGASISSYLLFSANGVPAGKLMSGPKQTSVPVATKAHQGPAAVSKAIRPAGKTTALQRSGPPSKRF